MSPSGTLERMTAASTMSTRQLAGAIIRDERARQQLTQPQAAERWNLSKTTLNRLEQGVETVSDLSFRYVEGGLGLPMRFFAYVLDGDVDRIKRLPSRLDDPVSGLREDLRLYVVDALISIAKPPRRRASDR